MRVALALPLIATLAPVACTSGEVIGGEALPVIANTTDCSPTSASCSTWQYLYDCYFGPTGIASCSAQSSCHGSAAGTGAGVSGFVCGSTADTCWRGMTGVTVPLGYPVLVHTGSSGATDPYLLATLYKFGTAMPTGMVEIANNMPLASVDTQFPSYAFKQRDLACVEGWIKGGASE